VTQKFCDLVKLDEIPQMESYFYMNRAGKACVAACPNLATESQKYAKSRDI